MDFAAMVTLDGGLTKEKPTRYSLSDWKRKIVREFFRIIVSRSNHQTIPARMEFLLSSVIDNLLAWNPKHYIAISKMQKTEIIIFWWI